MIRVLIGMLFMFVFMVPLGFCIKCMPHHFHFKMFRDCLRLRFTLLIFEQTKHSYLFAPRLYFLQNAAKKINTIYLKCAIWGREGCRPLEGRPSAAARLYRLSSKFSHSHK
jgi:hypothetical protein